MQIYTSVLSQITYHRFKNHRRFAPLSACIYLLFTLKFWEQKSEARNKCKDKLVSTSKRPKSSNLSYLVERRTPDNVNIKILSIRMNILKARMDIHSALKIHICDVRTDAKWRLPDLVQIESTLLSVDWSRKRRGGTTPRTQTTWYTTGSGFYYSRKAQCPPPFSTITWLSEPRSENIVKILNDRQIGMIQLEISQVLPESHLPTRKMFSFSGDIARTPDWRAMMTS